MAQATADHQLQGKHIAVLIADGVDTDEFREPLNAVVKAGGDATVLAPAIHDVKANDGTLISVDMPVSRTDMSAFDGLVIPGGTRSADALAHDEHVVNAVRKMVAEGKPIAALCHGTEVLAAADVVTDRTVTSHPDVRSTLVGAGALWVDEHVTVDEGLVTGQTHEDISQFVDKTIEELAEGIHPGQRLS